MAGDWDCFLLWIYTGSLNFRAVFWACSQTVLAKERGSSGVDQVHCCKHSFLLCHPISQTLQLLIATRCSPSCVTCHCPAHCLVSLGTKVCVLRISSFMKDKFPPGKTVGLSSVTRFSEAITAHLWAAVSSKGQRLSKHCSLQPRKELKLVAGPPLWKGQDFTPRTLSSFQKPFLCCGSKTFSFPFRGCFILWVRCGLCLQGVLHVWLQLWIANA